MSKRIAIVGAGWVGIGALSVLRDAGHHVEVLEGNDDIGGVWHPKNCYADLSIHGPAFTVEYFDHPLPKHLDKSRPITSGQIFRYLQSYCKSKDLYSYITFGIHIEKISYDSNTKTVRLKYTKKDKEDSHFSKEYDYVIYTHGSADRTIPTIDGAEKFRGSLLHSFDANENVLQPLIKEDKNVTIVGGSKTAADLILYFSRFAFTVDWLYRKNYWFLRETPYRQILQNTMRGKRSGFFYRLFYKIGDSLKLSHPRLNLWIWRICGIIDTFGEKHSDFKRFHGGRLDDNQLKVLKDYDCICGQQGEIESFCENGVTLADGSFVESDVVIFCTGSGGSGSLVEIEVDGKHFPIDEITEVYRSRVIIEIPPLIFTAFSDFNIGTVNGLLYGDWISKYISAGLDTEFLRQEATHFDLPFFASNFLFDSKRYFLKREYAMLDAFYESGELCSREVAEWREEYEFSGKALPPFSFRRIKSAVSD